MKKSANVLLLFLFINSFLIEICYGQQSKYLENKADSFKTNFLFEQALKCRLEIYKQNKSLTSNIFEIAGLFSLCDKKDSVFVFLNEATKNDSTILFLTNPDFYFVMNDEKWHNLRNRQVEKYESCCQMFKNKQLTFMLWDMLLKDQAYYSFIDDSKPEESKKYWNIKDSLNSENLQKLDSILINFGWPKISEVGNKANLTAFLIVQHSNLYSQKKYFPLLKEAVKKNEALKKHLALLIDIIRIQENKKQIYGTQVNYDLSINKYVFNYKETRNPKRINKRRVRMELPPIEEYLKTWDIEWSLP